MTDIPVLHQTVRLAHRRRLGAASPAPDRSKAPASTNPGAAAYSASKAAMNQLARAVALALFGCTTAGQLPIDSGDERVI